VLMEAVKRGPDRIDIEELLQLDNSGPELTGGYVLAIDRPAPGESGIRTERGVLLNLVDPTEEVITPEQKSYLSGFLNSFEGALFGPDFCDPQRGYSAYIDTDSFIDHQIFVETLKNVYGYRLSTYLYKDRGGELNIGPLWYYEECLGNANYLNGWLPEGWYLDDAPGENHAASWYQRLFEDPGFVERYARRWRALREERLSTHNMIDAIEANAALLSEAQERNFQRFQILGVYVSPNWFIGQTYEEEIGFLRQWLEDRLAWIDGQVDLLAPAGLQRPGDLDQDGALTISDAVGVLRLLFAGAETPLPCAGESLQKGGNLALLDVNDDRGVDVSDAVYTLLHLFAGGPSPALGDGCVRIEDCPSVCVD
jgi:hypothetical protein